MIERTLKYGLNAGDKFLDDCMITKSEFEDLVFNCNEYKKRSKDAQSYSSDLFLALVIQQKIKLGENLKFDSIIINTNDNNMEI